MNKAQELLKLAYRKGYRVRGDGVVENACGHARKLTLQVGKDGYKRYKFNIRDGCGASRAVLVHRLQAYQKFRESMFVPGIQVRHKNGNSLDNSTDNILIGTASQNMMDKPKEERQRLAGNANRKHSPELIEKIRGEHDAGVSYNKLSKKYGLSKSMLSFHLSKTAKSQAMKSSQQAVRSP